MNITYVLGNGFDIALGLKTKYEDFYRYLVDITKNEDLEHNLKTVVDDIEKYLNKNEKSINWSDFEWGLKLYLEENDISISNFKHTVIELFNHLMKYIRIQNNKALTFGDENIHFKINNFIINQFFEKPYEDTSVNQREKLSDYFGRPDNYYTFLTFNYTYTLEKIFANFYGSKYNIYHLHGAIDNNPLLGIDNFEQIEKKGNRNFKYEDFDFFLKPILSEVVGTDDLAQERIKFTDLFIIFGTSLGETDKKWWQAISNRFNSSSCCIVYFDYSDSYEISYNNGIEYRENSKIVLEKLAKKLNLSIPIKELRKRIFLVNKSKKFLNISYIKRMAIESLEKEKISSMARRISSM